MRLFPFNRPGLFSAVLTSVLVVPAMFQCSHRYHKRIGDYGTLFTQIIPLMLCSIPFMIIIFKCTSGIVVSYIPRCLCGSYDSDMESDQEKTVNFVRCTYIDTNELFY